MRRQETRRASVTGWKYGQFELVWHQLEVGGESGNPWTIARGMIWCNSPIALVARIYVRDNRYRIETISRELSTEACESLKHHLTDMGFSAMEQP